MQARKVGRLAVEEDHSYLVELNDPSRVDFDQYGTGPGNPATEPDDWYDSLGHDIALDRPHTPEVI